MSNGLWAQIFLSKNDCERIRRFFISDIGIREEYLIYRLHLTCYYSKVIFPEILPEERKIQIVIPATETRFMVMIPGGENPIEGVHPGMNKVGIRIKNCTALKEIIDLRNELSKYETPELLNGRKHSNSKKSAFGRFCFQPHISLLKPGNGITNDLTVVGKLF